MHTLKDAKRGINHLMIWHWETVRVGLVTGSHSQVRFVSKCERSSNGGPPTLYAQLCLTMKSHVLTVTQHEWPRGRIQDEHITQLLTQLRRNTQLFFYTFWEKSDVIVFLFCFLPHKPFAYLLHCYWWICLSFCSSYLCYDAVLAFETTYWHLSRLLTVTPGQWSMYIQDSSTNVAVG